MGYIRVVEGLQGAVGIVATNSGESSANEHGI